MHQLRSACNRNTDTKKFESHGHSSRNNQNITNCNGYPLNQGGEKKSHKKNKCASKILVFLYLNQLCISFALFSSSCDALWPVEVMNKKFEHNAMKLRVTYSSSRLLLLVDGSCSLSQFCSILCNAFSLHPSTPLQLLDSKKFAVPQIFYETWRVDSIFRPQDLVFVTSSSKCTKRAREEDEQPVTSKKRMTTIDTSVIEEDEHRSACCKLPLQSIQNTCSAVSEQEKKQTVAQLKTRLQYLLTKRILYENIQLQEGWIVKRSIGG